MKIHRKIQPLTSKHLTLIVGILYDEDGKIIFQGEFKDNEYWNGKGN